MTKCPMELSSEILETRQNASDKLLATIVRNDTVDEGICAFTLWIGASEENASVAMPISMKNSRQEINNKVAVSLHDNILQKDILVSIVEGIPLCNGCRANDCAHIGFAVCAEQLNVRSKLE